MIIESMLKQSSEVIRTITGNAQKLVSCICLPAFMQTCRNLTVFFF